MKLLFITGNVHKFEEVRMQLPEIERLDIELDEIQELDPMRVVEHKLTQASVLLTSEKGQDFDGLIIEDTSFVIESWQGLPGPFIKWFIKALGVIGFAQLVVNAGHTRAVGQTIVGYISRTGERQFFVGQVKGRVVVPATVSDFGWDSLFLPDGQSQTFGQMSKQLKITLSMRSIAIGHLKRQLMIQ